MAEGILQRMAEERGMDWTVDSAGTSNWHTGEHPDKRAIAECKRHNLDISSQRARQFRKSDFEEFDLILTMDKANFNDVSSMAESHMYKGKLFPITDFMEQKGIQAVPDPYYDGSFGEVYALLEEVCAAVIDTYENGQKAG